MAENVLGKIKSLLSDLIAVGEEEVVPGAFLVDDLGADSLDLVKFIEELEKEYSKGDFVLEITDEDAEDIETVQHVIDMLKAKGIS